MKDDYLWDQTGEPDPEIQQLEEILGTLRHQPRALEIPADLEVGGKRNLFRSFRLPLAVAAAIALLLFGTALWFGLQRLRSQPSESLATNPEVVPMRTVATPSPETAKEALTVNSDDKDKSVEVSKHVRRPNSSVVVNKNRSPKEPTSSPQLATNQQEALAARDQLFLALRVASTKLNFAQRKTQSPNTKDQIQNQHRIG